MTYVPDFSIRGTRAQEIAGCAVFAVGNFEVSVSNVFGANRSEATAVFRKLSREKPAKTFYGNSADTVVEAIRWAKRAHRRDLAKAAKTRQEAGS